VVLELDVPAAVIVGEIKQLFGGDQQARLMEARLVAKPS
jgi:hypothetical protein